MNEKNSILEKEDCFTKIALNEDKFTQTTLTNTKIEKYESAYHSALIGNTVEISAVLFIINFK